VDGRPAIDRWYPQISSTHDAFVTAGGGSLEVKIEFFQAVGGYHLWAQLAPRSDDARKATAALGGGVPSVEWDAGNAGRFALENPDDRERAYRHGHALARAGRFDESASAFARGTRIAPSDLNNWRYLACLRAYAGDDAAYRTYALAILDRFSDAADPAECERVIRACTLAPGPQATDPRIEGLRKRMFDRPGGQRPEWLALAEGMAHYRGGRYEPAIESLRTSVARILHPDWVSAKATGELFIAMSQHRLGHYEKARSTLAGTLEFFERKAGRPGVDDLWPGEPDNWLKSHTVRREAEALINGADNTH
jgi:tetratricopeptide (TPR) repeat protein